MSFFGRIAILAPEKPRSTTRRKGPLIAAIETESKPFDDADHPILKVLRDRALEDLAEWLGLESVPPQLWKILQEEPDPEAAIIYFIRSVGCDPKKARRRDPAELLRLETITDALFSWSRLSSSHDPMLMRRMQATMMWGTSYEIDLFKENVDALATILGLYESLPPEYRFVRHSRLVRRANAYKSHPLAWRPVDRESARRESHELIEAVRKYTSIAPRFDELIKRLLPICESLPGDDPNVEIIRGAHSLYGDDTEYGDIRKNLFVSGMDDPWGLVSQLSVFLEILVDAAHEIDGAAGAHRDDGDRSRTIPEGMTVAVWQAFVELDLDGDHPPNYRTAKKVWKDKIKTYHPDHDPNGEEITKKINLNWDIVEDWYKSSGRTA